MPDAAAEIGSSLTAIKALPTDDLKTLNEKYIAISIIGIAM